MTAQSVENALAPLRSALLAAATRNADKGVADASAQAEQRIAAARAAADQRLVDARASGQADAAFALAGEAATARQKCRAVLLEAESWVHDERRRQTREAVQQLCADARRYADLRTAVVRQARAILGADATCRDLDVGGWVIETSGRQIDVSIDALTDWALGSIDATTPGEAATPGAAAPTWSR